MIPANPEELRILAGEYVLGVLEADEANEVTAAVATNVELRRAVAFWEERLNPLSNLASPTGPPPGTWPKIEAWIKETAPKPSAQGFWDNVVLWRWATAGFAAAAAALAFWIAVAPITIAGPSFVAVLRPPQQDQPSWVATAGRDGLMLRSIGAPAPPSDRAFELWAIAPGSTRPRSLGVIPASGEIKISPLPADLRDGATLAISVEPVGGSPTQQPTGPVVFAGSVKAV